MRPSSLKDVKDLREIWGGFRAARVLLTANNYRLFDYLVRPLSARKISIKAGMDLRAAEILLDALAGIGLLIKRGRTYKNTRSASRCLVPGAPYYQGDIIRHADTLWRNWSALDEVVRTGRPRQGARDMESFILGMHNNASLKAEEVIRMIGLKDVKTALDLGGGPGTYSIAMARKGVKVTLFDRPEAIGIAKRIFKEEKVGGVTVAGGDFLSDDIGSGYDLILVSQILHSYSDRQNLRILKKCRDSLNWGGRIVVQDFFIDNTRSRPAQSALFSVNMLVNTEAGRCYTPHEIKKWLSAAGLKIASESTLDDTVLITGLRNG